MTEMTAKSRWLALYVLCLGDLMIVLDQSIVNVALPSIRADLGFSQASLAWVVNAYLLTFGGFLLLSGRLGDLLGNRRVFLGGVVSFTVASAVCGLAPQKVPSVSEATRAGCGRLRDARDAGRSVMGAGSVRGCGTKAREVRHGRTCPARVPSRRSKSRVRSSMGRARPWRECGV